MCRKDHKIYKSSKWCHFHVLLIKRQYHLSACCWVFSILIYSKVSIAVLKIFPPIILLHSSTLHIYVQSYGIINKLWIIFFIGTKRRYLTRPWPNFYWVHVMLHPRFHIFVETYSAATSAEKIQSMNFLSTPRI